MARQEFIINDERHAWPFSQRSRQVASADSRTQQGSGEKRALLHAVSRCAWQAPIPTLLRHWISRHPLTQAKEPSEETALREARSNFKDFYKVATL